MARLSKCKGCGKILQSDEKYTYANKTYCSKCYDLKMKEREDYDNLIQWICKYFNQVSPNGMILKQIKDYKETFQYTYAGITYCLWYLTEIKGIKLEIKYGIGLVKFEYENAKNYFLQQQSIQNSVKNIEPPIQITRKVKMKTNRNYNNKFLINIDEMISEGD